MYGQRTARLRRSDWSFFHCAELATPSSSALGISASHHCLVVAVSNDNASHPGDWRIHTVDRRWTDDSLRSDKKAKSEVARCHDCRKRLASNQSMKPTAPLRSKF